MEQTRVYSKDVTDIIDQFNNKENVVSNEQLLNWMQSQYIEVLATIYNLITRKKYYKKITPGLAVTDYSKFIMNYFKRCILENSTADLETDFWALSRYDAGYDIVRWFRLFWNDSTVPRTIIKELKKWLENIYRDGDDEIRECIITATLEHLFDDEEIATYFSDWRSDQILSSAYERAMECAGKIFG